MLYGADLIQEPRSKFGHFRELIFCIGCEYSSVLLLLEKYKPGIDYSKTIEFYANLVQLKTLSSAFTKSNSKPFLFRDYAQTFSVSFKIISFCFLQFSRRIKVVVVRSFAGS